MNYIQSMSDILFIAFALMTVLGAYIAVTRVVLLMHTVLGLALCMLGISGLYFFLGSMFMALMQVLIYIGALCVVLVFGIMVSYTPSEINRRRITGKHLPLALTACILVAAPMGLLVLNTQWRVSTAFPSGDIGPLGEMLLYKYCMAFELISVILLIGIVGSIILARGGHVTDEEASVSLDEY
ncbi:MAG: NADH-quinone oxidoreductase subunit J [Pseudomonadota bacterium]